jgi:hypothetical protein
MDVICVATSLSRPRAVLATAGTFARRDAYGWPRRRAAAGTGSRGSGSCWGARDAALLDCVMVDSVFPAVPLVVVGAGMAGDAEAGRPSICASHAKRTKTEEQDEGRQTRFHARVSFLDLAKCRGHVALPEKQLPTPRRRAPGLARVQHNTAGEDTVAVFMSSHIPPSERANCEQRPAIRGGLRGCHPRACIGVVT